MKPIPQGLCRNVFQDGRETPSKAAVTKKWIQLVNLLEKRKAPRRGSLP